MKINKIDFLKVGETILAVTLMMAPFAGHADLPQPGCGSFNGALRCDATGPNDIIVKALNIILGISFLVAVLFLVIGGFRYIISGGNEDQAKAGRKTIVNALIGIAVIILSYVIVQVISKTVSSGGNNSGV